MAILHVLIFIAALLIGMRIGSVGIGIAAGGMDYLTYLVEKLLWRKPKAIVFLGPITAYFMTILAGTGHSTFSVLPVVVDVSKQRFRRHAR